MIETLQAVSSAVLLVAVASAMYLAGAFVWLERRTWQAIAAGTVVLAAVTWATCAAWANVPEPAVVTLSPPVHFSVVLTLLAGLALVLLAGPTADEAAPAEYMACLLLVVAGGVLVAMASELILLFLGLELISIPTYLLLYLARRDAVGQESAAKYFFLSVLSAALFLYGVSLVYGAAGSTYLASVAGLDARAGAPVPGPVVTAGLLLIVAGLGFKIAAVPFHFYAPDVYQGTSTAMAAVLSWAPKAAGVFALVQIACWSLPAVGAQAAWVFWLLAAATMTLGNLMALLQDNLRRLLAYSSIAHAGYILVGVGAGCVGGGPYLTADGAESAVFYLLVYAAMTVGTFAMLVYLASPQRPVETVDDLAGLAGSHPPLAAALAIMLISLTGIPVTAGFWGKLALFASAVTCNDRRYVWLAVIGVINAAISAYYYLRIVGAMYMRTSYRPVQPAGGRGPLSVAAAGAVMTIVIGLFPGPFLDCVRRGGPAAGQAPATAAAASVVAVTTTTTGGGGGGTDSFGHLAVHANLP